MRARTVAAVTPAARMNECRHWSRESTRRRSRARSSCAMPTPASRCAAGRPRIPPGTSVDPGGMVVGIAQRCRRRGRSRRRRGGRRRRSAARHGLPGRRRRRRARCVAVERHPLGAGRARPGRGARGGAKAWADAVGSVPVASFTVTKLRWLAEHEPDNAARTAAVCLPHDWLTWRLRGDRRDRRTRHRSRRRERHGLLVAGRPSSTAPTCCDWPSAADPLLPTVLGPAAAAGTTTAGCRARSRHRRQRRSRAGRRARAAATSSSRSGRRGWSARSARHPTADPSGIVAGFADATGAFLPLVCTLNAARVLESTARLLGVSLAELSDLALVGPAGCRRAGARAVLRRRAHAQPSRRVRLGARSAARQRDAGAPGPRRGGGAALRARRRARRAAGRGRGDRAGPARRRRCALRGVAADRADGLRDAGRRARRPASTSRTVRRARPRGCCPGADEPPEWDAGAVERYEADADPGGARALRRGARADRVPPDRPARLAERTEGDRGLQGRGGRLVALVLLRAGQPGPVEGLLRRRRR